MGSLAETLDFTINIINPGETTYGFKLKNGSFTGTLADVLNGNADAAFNSRFLFRYGSPEIEFFMPVLGDKVCVITPAADKVPQWKAIFKCFDIYFWSTFTLITFGSGLIFWIMKRYQEKCERSQIPKTFLLDFKKFIRFDETNNINNILTTTWKVMIGINAIMPKSSMERFFIGSCLLANVIISGTFEVLFST